MTLRLLPTETVTDAVPMTWRTMTGGGRDGGHDGRTAWEQPWPGVHLWTAPSAPRSICASAALGKAGVARTGMERRGDGVVSRRGRAPRPAEGSGARQPAVTSTDHVQPAGGARPSDPVGGDAPASPATDRRTAQLAAAGGAYLAAAVVLWWHVWTGGPATVTTCGCGDAARFLWFFEWPVYAIGHGHSVLYSQWLFHPSGINLLDDTSVLALGVVLGPVTALFGPVAGMNVALTLAPGRFRLHRVPAAAPLGPVAAGRLFGWCRLRILALRGHRAGPQPAQHRLPRRPPVGGAGPRRAAGAPASIALGCREPPSPRLVVVQFFLSTEVLVITTTFAVLGIAAVVVDVAVRSPSELRRRLRHTARGAAVAVVAAAVVLAYPLWFLLRGPAHLIGPIWSNGTALSEYGTTLSSFWRPGGLGAVRGLSLHSAATRARSCPASGTSGRAW